ncbi:hypothetical protein SOV_22530 [Sporomusa ovata DSM 2662]|uniref:Uncharacterized protein n=1 Tax=Sporomusa ovata TaxID=2378 RepID=A0A0U1L390_9FIRM|nr:hypothetical protein [Sporomusa ovata]EQB25569.1 hypothetical protein SOV_4c02320 [Sporomusa ovata DSM 2662]CQR74126.1 hypothetical protein SpAn4DRAFT_0588 [Sporomusa ovata]
MTTKLPMVGVRLEKLAHRKFNYISYMNGRSASKEGRQILLRYIEQYEKKNGEITLEQLQQLEERLRGQDT